MILFMKITTRCTFVLRRRRCTILSTTLLSRLCTRLLHSGAHTRHTHDHFGPVNARPMCCGLDHSDGTASKHAKGIICVKQPLRRIVVVAKQWHNTTQSSSQGRAACARAHTHTLAHRPTKCTTDMVGAGAATTHARCPRGTHSVWHTHTGRFRVSASTSQATSSKNILLIAPNVVGQWGEPRHQCYSCRRVLFYAHDARARAHMLNNNARLTAPQGGRILHLLCSPFNGPSC
jgi:hypothetical protein